MTYYCLSSSYVNRQKQEERRVDCLSRYAAKTMPRTKRATTAVTIAASYRSCRRVQLLPHHTTQAVNHPSVGLLQQSPSGVPKHAAFALVRPGTFSSTGIHVRTTTTTERTGIAPGVFRRRYGCFSLRRLSRRLRQATTTTAVAVSRR